MRRLTSIMICLLDHTGAERKTSAVGAIILAIGVIGLLLLGRNQLGSWPTIVLIVAVMVLFSFLFCAFETAIARFEAEWSNTGNVDQMRTWFTNLQKEHSNGKVTARRLQVGSLTFQLCSSYLDNPDRSFASLLSLAALVDVAGAVLITKFIGENGPIPGFVLETIIATVPLVIFSHLLGTMIGMRMPVKILRGFAILIWLPYVLGAFFSSRIADCISWHTEKLKSDPGYNTQSRRPKRLGEGS